MLVKLLIMLEGTSRHLDPDFSLMEVLRPYCEKLVLRRAGPRERARRALETGRDWTRLLGRLPGLLDDTARRIERGQVKIDMVHTGLEATVNRLDFKVGTGDWSDTGILPNAVKVKTVLILVPKTPAKP